MVRGTRSPCTRARARASSATCANLCGLLSLQHVAPFAQIPLDVPEQSQGTRKAQGQLHLLRSPRHSCLQDSSQVVQVLFEPSEPQQLVGTQQVRLGCLDQLQVVACVRPVGCFEFAQLVQLFQPELADGLQHDEARFCPLVRCLL